MSWCCSVDHSAGLPCQWATRWFPWSGFSGLGPGRQGKARGACLSARELLLDWKQLRVRVEGGGTLLHGLGSRGVAAGATDGPSQ